MRDVARIGGMGLRARWTTIVDRLSSSYAEAFAAGYARAAFRSSSRSRASAALVQAADEMSAKGEHAVAEALYRKAVGAGDHRAVVKLVNWPAIREDQAAMEAVYRAAITAGDVQSLPSLAALRARQGDTAEARVLFTAAAESGSVNALTMYATFLHNHGEPDELGEAIDHRRRQVTAGDTDSLPILGALLLKVPHRQVEAEAILRQGAALLENRCRCLLAALLLDRGATGEAAELVRRVRATGKVLVRRYAEQLAEEYELPS
ncbi:hypothetical protein ACGFIR_09330 [Micromonospora sp. NPDC049051]|uniref:hypothetical protein n=1 Tax=Micromonospora sp. NPDC049051 TaxID=3364264 RepID=UPI0037181F2F